MLLHNAITDAQPQPRPLSHALGGVKRLENAAGLLDPRTGIMELDHQGVLLRKDPNFKPALSSVALRVIGVVFGHGVQTIVDDVEKDLLQLVGVAEDRGNARFDFSLELDVA